MQKTSFKLAPNSAYPNLYGIVNIIGDAPDEIPYLSVEFRDKKTGLIAHGWVRDKDLETLAVNILKATRSKKLKRKVRKSK